MTVKTILFLVANFGALAIGGLLMGEGPKSEWYQNIAKAPWTPPGWVFGAAWFTIMVCFSFYMAKLYLSPFNRTVVLTLFFIQWVLNIVWNPTFFHFHQTLLALFFISTLTVLIGFLFFYYFKQLQYWSLLILPYFIWLIIATSLNGYIYFKNS